MLFLNDWNEFKYVNFHYYKTIFLFCKTYLKLQFGLITLNLVGLNPSLPSQRASRLEIGFEWNNVESRGFLMCCWRSRSTLHWLVKSQSYWSSSCSWMCSLWFESNILLTLIFHCWKHSCLESLSCQNVSLHLKELWNLTRFVDSLLLSLLFSLNVSCCCLLLCICCFNWLYLLLFLEGWGLQLLWEDYWCRTFHLRCRSFRYAEFLYMM